MMGRIATRRGLVSGVGAGALGLLALVAAQAPAMPAAAAGQPFVRYDAKTRTATLRIIAGYNGVDGGFNFNGGAHGAAVITVPLGVAVVATFVNNVPTPHSALIVPYSTALPAKTPAPAFKGAASADYLNGAEKGDPVTTFRFQAGKAGTYLLICGVPGHDAAGMWDRFVVSPTAKTATFRVL